MIGMKNRGDRRRRVLADERLMSSDRESSVDTSSKSQANGSAPRYAAAALVEHQPRICDFLPLRPWTMMIWFLVGTTLVVGHATLFVLHRSYSGQIGIHLAPLELIGPSTLTTWTSSFLLIISAVIATVIVQFRRHRIDDYRAEYRVWYYFIFGLVLASINASVGGHEIAWHATEQATQAFEIKHAGWWMNGLTSVFVTCVGVRLLLEVRSSRGTVVTGLLAGSTYLTSWLIAVDVINLPTEKTAILAAGMARLMSHFLLMMTLVVYARFVFLDAQGQITGERLKEKKVKNKKAEKQAAANKLKLAAASKGSKPKPASPEKEAEPAAAPQERDSDEYDVDDPIDSLKLTKSERRKLRKQKRRDRRAA